MVCTRKGALALSVILLLLPSIFANDDADDEFLHEEEEIPRQDLGFILEHAFGDGQFRERGIVTLNSPTSKYATVKQTLSSADADALYNLAKKGKTYQFRLRAASSDVYVQSYVAACPFYYSGLQDTLIIHLDSRGNPQAIEANLLSSECPSSLSKRSKHKLKSTVIIQRGLEGPTPELDGFIAEQRKKERTGGSGDENKSFFAKYWMYIVPLMIFVMMGGGAEEPKQGGGAAGGGGAPPARVASN